MLYDQMFPTIILNVSWLAQHETVYALQANGKSNEAKSRSVSPNRRQIPVKTGCVFKFLCILKAIKCFERTRVGA